MPNTVIDVLSVCYYVPATVLLVRPVSGLSGCVWINVLWDRFKENEKYLFTGTLIL